MAESKSNTVAADSEFFLGRKIFFIHPNDMLHNGLVMPVLREEYQVYEIDTEEDVLSAVKQFPDAVLFFCLANAKPEFSFTSHAKLIDKLYQMSDPHTLRIGIICDTDSTSLRRSALYNTGINGVFAPLSKGYETVLKNIIKYLKLIGAKSVRKYVRAVCDEEDNAFVTLHVADNAFTGSIMDVSSVSFSAKFDNDPNLSTNTQISDTVLNIRGVDVAIPCHLFGVHKIDGSNGIFKQYVMLFDNNVAVDKSPIYDYIYYCLRRDLKL